MVDKNYQLIKLDEIFANGTRKFQIPAYQRGYSWEAKQWQDLIDDIKRLVEENNKNYLHYTGTIVATQNNDNNFYDIVDGQQRLTTLTIILSVIHQYLEDETPQKFQIDELFLIKDRLGNPFYHLELGSAQRDLFKCLLKHEQISENHHIKTKSDENLLNAFKFFQNFFIGYTNSELIEYYNAVSCRLGFLFYAPRRREEASLMFEVINNRGKPLSELEKIKNYIYYYAETHNQRSLIETLEQRWPIILANLQECHLVSNNDEDNFLRNCWLVFWDTHKHKSHHVYQSLKESDISPESMHSLIMFVENASRTYVKIFGYDRSLSSKEKQIIKLIEKQNTIASILPIIIAVYSRLTKDEDEIDRIEILDYLEKLNFRYYGTGIASRNDSSQGLLFYYAYQFYQDFNTIDANDEEINANWLKKKLTDFINEHANDKALIKHLTLDKDESGDYYRWPELKYFLANYEIELAGKHSQSLALKYFFATPDQVRKGEKLKNDIFQKEHIWAREFNAPINIDNKEELELADMQKRRLGNFILLNAGANKSQNKNAPEIKIETYKIGNEGKNKEKLYLIDHVETDFQEALKFINNYRQKKTRFYHQELYTKFIDIREQSYVNFALKRWNFKGNKNSINEVKIDSFSNDNEVYKIL